MKRYLLLFAGIMFFCQLASAQEFYTTDVSQIPENAKTFITKHFPKETISHILIDKEIFSTEYEVKLSNGQEVKFDKNGEWKEIDGKKKPLPESVVPNKVSSYVKHNFSGTTIEQIERKSWGWEVELMNGIELKLDKEGKLLKIDD